MTDSQKRLLLQAVTTGAGRCLERMSRACGAPWSLEQVTAVFDAEGYLEPLLGDVFVDHFGSLIAIPDAMFLVVFDRASALKLSMRHAGDLLDAMSASVNELESTILGELSNILVDPLVESLVSASGRSAIPSAPEPLVETMRELLRSALKRFKDVDRLAATYYIRLACPRLPARCTLIALLSSELAEKVAVS